MWDESIRISIPFWWVRMGSGLLIIAGQTVFAVNVIRTARSKGTAVGDTPAVAA
jgi:cbb3-type cytochrome oxidase subunit 1